MPSIKPLKNTESEDMVYWDNDFIVTNKILQENSDTECEEYQIC